MMGCKSSGGNDLVEPGPTTPPLDTGDTVAVDSGLPDTGTVTDTGPATETGTVDSGTVDSGTYGYTPTWPTSSTRRHDCSGFHPADAGPFGGRVAFTFDDGPHVVYTPQVLEILRDYDVPATFFVTGNSLSNVDTWPIMDDIVVDPLFDVGNHTFVHPLMTSLSLADAEEEVDDTQLLIEGWGVSPAFFRFPYGDADCDLVDMVRGKGLNVTGWQVDSSDWCYAAGSYGQRGECPSGNVYTRIPEGFETDMRGHILAQLARWDGGAVLFHDVNSYTPEMLEDVIIDIVSAGYTFVPLSDADTFPALNSGTTDDLPYLGERCSLTHDRCFMTESFAWCEPVDPADSSSDVGLCTMPCTGTCLDRDGAATTFCADVAGTGQCTAYSADENSYCADIPGSLVDTMDRFGSYGMGEVCIASHW